MSATAKSDDSDSAEASADYAPARLMVIRSDDGDAGRGWIRFNSEIRRKMGVHVGDKVIVMNDPPLFDNNSIALEVRRVDDLLHEVPICMLDQHACRMIQVKLMEYVIVKKIDGETITSDERRLADYNAAVYARTHVDSYKLKPEIPRKGLHDKYWHEGD